MMHSLKSEFRKLLSIRSTYILSAVVIFLVVLIGGYITGYRAVPLTLRDPHYLIGQVYGAVGAMSILIAITGVLLFGHEYRYNTIIYTVTLSKSRSVVFASKMLVTTVYALLMGTLVVLLTLASTIIGVKLHNHQLAHQLINYGDLFWRSLFTVWGFAMFGFIIIALFRNLVAGIVILLLLPTTIESILSLLLKSNAKFLPFSSLLNVVSVTPQNGESLTRSVITVMAYLVFGWVVAWLLFLRRDAN